MSTISHQTYPFAPGAEDRTDLLLIDADPSDVLMVEKMLAESGLDAVIAVASDLAEARRSLTRRTQCILVDLSTPGIDRLDGLRQVLALSETAAVVVLTGLDDAHLGVQAENARLERGLLPVPLIEDASLRHHTRYRPGRRRALLGGDFYDTVQTEGGAVHLMIGDVCGHGPDEAALGVQLRMAWRTLVLAGHTGEQLLGTLDTVLGHERRSEEIFTTLCMITIAPSRRTARMHLAGHPAPLLFHGVLGEDGEVAALPDYAHGPALGLLPGAEWPTTEIDLGDSWGLMLYTDGLIEGKVGPGSDRLGTDGLVGLARKARGSGATGRALIDDLVTEVEHLNGDALTDDLAVLLLSRQPGRELNGS